MTTPLTRRQQEEQEAQAEALEDAIAAATTEDVDEGLSDLFLALTVLWIVLHGSTEDVDPDRLEEFRDQARQVIGRLAPGLGYDDLHTLLLPAHTLGARHAAEALDLDDVDLPDAHLGIEVQLELFRLPERIQAAYDAAETLLGSVEEYDDLVPVVAVAGRAHTTAERTARWAANRAIAEGATEVADAHGAQRVWVAERNACLHCLAYAGQTARAGQSFRAGLTFADRPLNSEPVPNPPLHPHCRCRVQPWLGQTADGSTTTFPEGLRREAEREVALGRSAYASEPARLRAAERLLRAGAARIPPSVRQRARSAVQRGRFAES